MKNKFVLVIVLLWFSCCNAQGAGKVKSNTVSYELGKTELIHNVNFDHKFGLRNYGFRLGVGTNLARYINVILFGGGGYYLFGKPNRFFETGIDIQYLSFELISDDQVSFGSFLTYPNYSIQTRLQKV